MEKKFDRLSLDRLIEAISSNPKYNTVKKRESSGLNVYLEKRLSRDFVSEASPENLDLIRSIMSMGVSPFQTYKLFTHIYKLEMERFGEPIESRYIEYPDVRNVWDMIATYAIENWKEKTTMDILNLARDRLHLQNLFELMQEYDVLVPYIRQVLTIGNDNTLKNLIKDAMELKKTEKKFAIKILYLISKIQLEVGDPYFFYLRLLR